MDIRAIADIVDAHPLLPAERQLELAACVRRGVEAGQELAENGHDPARSAELRESIADEDEAREALILHNASMVLKVAWQYTSYMDLEDLFQEGIIGLISAIERFDPDYGTQLSTHAYYWIRQAIVRAISIKSRTIRLSTHQHHRITRLSRMRRELARDLEREPTWQEMDEAVAQAGDTPAIGVAELMRIATPPISLDAPERTSGDPLGWSMADPENIAEVALDKAMREDMEYDDVHRRVMAVVETLPAREALAVKLRYGLDGHHPHTLQEIGDTFGVTRERARQIVNSGVGRLRHPSRSRRLKGLL